MSAAVQTQSYRSAINTLFQHMQLNEDMRLSSVPSRCERVTKIITINVEYPDNKDIVKCNATYANLYNSILSTLLHKKYIAAVKLVIWLLSKHPISQRSQLTKQLFMQ